MTPGNRLPAHPGVVLKDGFMKPMGLTQVALAEHLGVPVQRVNEIIKGKRGVTPRTAWLLAQAFGTAPGFWTSLQADYDLAVHRPRKKVGRLRRGR